MSSDFSGKFIPSTYENLLQIGVNNSVQGSVVFTGTGDVNTIVDGRGRRVTGLVIDQSNNSSGGVYFKQSSKLQGLNVLNSELRFLLNTSSTTYKNLSIDERGVVVGQDYDPQGPFPNITNTYQSDIKMYVKSGVYIKSDATQTGYLKSDDRLVISAENDNELYDAVNLITQRDENVISSGVQIIRYPVNTGQPYYVCVWSRSGNVITCDVWIDHDNTGPGSSLIGITIFNLPVNIGSSFGIFQTSGIQQYESFTGLVGHGINFKSSPSTSQAVEFKPHSDRQYKITNTLNNSILSGITRGRFSYKLN